MTNSTQWVTLCKRTEDPKLAFIEALLTARGIPSQRAGRSGVRHHDQGRRLRDRAHHDPGLRG